MARKLSASIENSFEPFTTGRSPIAPIARVKASRWEVRTKALPSAVQRVRELRGRRHLRDKVPVICTGSKLSFSLWKSHYPRDAILHCGPIGRQNRAGDEEFSNFVLAYCATYIGKEKKKEEIRRIEERSISLLQCLHFV